MLVRLGEIAASGRFLAGAPLAIAILMEGADSPELDAGRALAADGAGGLGGGHGDVLRRAADGGPATAAVKDLLGIPDSTHLITVLPFGYRARTPRGKRRRPLSEIAHDGTYGVPYE